MNDKDAIELLEKQLITLEQAGIDMSGDRKFFSVGEWELALEGVYVTNMRRPGVLVPEEIKALVDDFEMDISEFSE